MEPRPAQVALSFQVCDQASAVNAFLLPQLWVALDTRYLAELLGAFQGRSVGLVLLLLVVVAVLAELGHFLLDGVHVDVVHAGLVLNEV